jgi:hypothetical protein
VSNALAFAGVTAVLKDLLDTGMIDHEVTDIMGQGVTVSAVAPDSIQLGNEMGARLNLFMHQATPNAAWRNAAYPSRDASGRRIANAPLAVDLHYLLTAYSNADLQAEVLLGYAMQLFHETPVLARDTIRTALNPPNPPVAAGNLLPSVYQALRASDLADQYEQIKITPSVMNTEELSKLWTAIQSHYRPTAAYQVTVVLIESQRQARSSLPVLTRNIPPHVNLPAGIHTAQLQLVRGADPAPVSTSAFPLTIAPQVGGLATPLNVDANGDLALTPTCTPQVRSNQTVSLLLGGIEVFAEPSDGQTATPTFGELVFVTACHGIRCGPSVTLTEEQDIVYREAARPGEAPPEPALQGRCGPAALKSRCSWTRASLPPHRSPARCSAGIAGTGTVAW